MSKIFKKIQQFLCCHDWETVKVYEDGPYKRFRFGSIKYTYCSVKINNPKYIYLPVKDKVCLKCGKRVSGLRAAIDFFVEETQRAKKAKELWDIEEGE